MNSNQRLQIGKLSYADVAFTFASPGLGKMAFLDQIRWQKQIFYNLEMESGQDDTRSHRLARNRDRIGWCFGHHVRPRSLILFIDFTLK
jgi:hypothetical protein